MAVFSCTHLIFLCNCAIISEPMIKSKKDPKSVKVSTKSLKEDENKTEANPKVTNFFLITIIGIVIIAAIVILAKNFLTKDNAGQPVQQQAQEQKQEGQADQNDIDKLINRVSQLIEIKKDESPTVATVQDPAKLQETQPIFYKDAQMGDRLLVWSDKAVLYSTSKDKLISVMLIDQQQISADAPVENSASSTTDTMETTVADENASITVLNGTRTAGLAGKMRTKLTDGGINVTSVGDASLKTYTKTVIVKLSDKEMPATVKALQEATGAEVVTSADGETALKGDFTVIVGEDFVE